MRARVPVPARWHWDGHYWPIKPFATTSVWTAVIDCTVKRRCRRAIPGSHAAREIGRHFRDHSDRVLPRRDRRPDHGEG